MAADNDSATFWCSAALPTPTTPQTLTIDLQTLATLDTIRILSRSPFGPRDITILTSLDQQTWTLAATATLPNTDGPHTLFIPPTQARWLRLQNTSAYSTTNVQVKEVEAYSTP